MIENRFKPYKIHVFVYFEDKYAHHAWRHGFTLYQDMHMNIKGGGQNIKKFDFELSPVLLVPWFRKHKDQLWTYMESVASGNTFVNITAQSGSFLKQIFAFNPWDWDGRFKYNKRCKQRKWSTNVQNRLQNCGKTRPDSAKRLLIQIYVPPKRVEIRSNIPDTKIVVPQCNLNNFRICQIQLICLLFEINAIILI